MKMGKVISGSNAIQELEGGIGRQLEEWTSALLFSMSQVMELTGITPSVAATTINNPDKGLGVTEYEADATSHALYPLRNAIINFKDKAAKCIAMKTLLTIRYDEYTKDYYTKVIGRDGVEAIIAMGDTTLEELAIYLESYPTRAEKQELLMMVDSALKVGKDGQVRISTSDALYITDMINKDQLKVARWYLALSEERAVERYDQRQMASMEANGQVQIQSAQAAAMAELQKEQQLAPLRLQEYAAKANIDLQKEQKLLELKGDQKLEQISLEATMEAQLGVEVKGSV
jgi:hypothetical protein